MKGLFSALGLIAALFISNAYASIFDAADFGVPSSTQDNLYCLSSNYQDCLISGSDFSGIQQMLTNANQMGGSFGSWSEYGPQTDCGAGQACTYSQTYRRPWYYQDGSIGGYQSDVVYVFQSTSVSCPPDSNPNYTFEYDLNADGTPERCYNPNELDQLSQCSQLANGGMLLPAIGSGSPNVCQQYLDGARCAFSLVQQGNAFYYAPNLETSCFGDGNPIPDYDEPNPPPEMPSDGECKPYTVGSVAGTTSFVCQADPDNYCTSEFDCLDGCGYVNDQFVCFRDTECTGASCEPSPVNCESLPDAPVCKEKETIPEPSFCEKNPQVAGCQAGSDFCSQNPTAPSCTFPGSGGGGAPAEKFVLDYDKLTNGMKDAAKLLIDENETPEFSDTQSQIDDKTSELDSKIDDFMNGAHFDSLSEQVGTDMFSGHFLLPSNGTCTPFELGDHVFDLCDVAARIRSIMYFVFAFITMVYLKNLFYSTVTPRKE